MNVTNAPSINTFGVNLFYDYGVLHVTSYDTTVGVFGSATDFPSVCSLELGLSSGCGAGGYGVFQITDHLLYGVVTSPSTNSTNGPLFRLTFKVVSTGFSQFFLQFAQLGYLQGKGGAVIAVPLKSVNGYFTDIKCPSSGSSYCTPPVPGVKVSPFLLGPRNVTEIVAGRPITFGASSSNSTNPNGKIISYTWDWGDGTTFGTTNSTSIHSYGLAAAGQDQIITLTVADNYTIPGSISFSIKVIRIWTDLVLKSAVADPVLRVLAGTKVDITVDLQNQSINPENATVVLTVAGRSFGNRTFTNLRPEEEVKYSIPWDTTGYAPKVYLVQAVVPLVRNETAPGRPIIENDTSIYDNNVGRAFVQIIEPEPAGFGVLLGLGLIQATGLGVLVLAGAAAASLLRRRKPLPGLDR